MKDKKVEKVQGQSEALRADLADQSPHHGTSLRSTKRIKISPISNASSRGRYGEHLEFVPAEEKWVKMKFCANGWKKTITARYKVNVFVDNSRVKQAPVIIENHPTFYEFVW